MPIRVLLAESLTDDAESRLAQAADVVRAPASDAAALCELIGDCDALIVRTHTLVPRAVLAAGRRLRVVGVAGVGLENVDLEAAASLGVKVLSTPAAATDAVADLTLALMLLLLRPVHGLAGAYRAGRFREARRAAHGPELRDLTIGIIGMGRIGSAVGRRCAAGFGARVLYNDIVDVGPFAFAAEPASKEAIWSTADIITLHVPLTAATRGLLNERTIALCRPTAYVINTARGPVIDTQALTCALQAGRLAGAGLDVVEPEPLPADHPLFACTACILTPHVAARTHGGLRRMCAIVDDVLLALRDRAGSADS